MKLSTKQLIDLCNIVLNAFLEHDDQLSKQEVIELIGEENANYYSVIVEALANIGKIIKAQGRSGGIRYRSVQKQQRSITVSNQKKLEILFGSDELEIPEIEYLENDDEPYSNDKDENDLYNPLKDYLDTSGYYDFVEVFGNARGGKGQWKNPDIVALSCAYKYKYHIGLYPKITTFEVKKQWPTIRDIQQTASYYRFSHFSYLCFFDGSYKGSDVNRITEKIKNEEIWDWAQTYNVGLIVCFKKQDRSIGYAFQTIKECTQKNIEFSDVEQAIETYFSEDVQKSLQERMKQIIKNIY